MFLNNMGRATTSVHHILQMTDIFKKFRFEIIALLVDWKR